MLALLIAVATMAPGAAQAAVSTQPAPPPVTTADVEAWLDGLVPGLIDSTDAAGGVVVSVVEGGELVTARGYGAAHADELTREATPLDPREHLVRIGSITKTFTALAVLQLVEQGSLDLDADVQTYLDFTLPTPRGAVTLRHLLSHTAGFEERLGGLDATRAEDMRSLRDVVSTDPPVQIFDPGNLPAYSNYSYDLAGYVVERVSGMPFEEYVQTRVIDPIGLSSTTVHQPVPDALEGRLASGFRERGSEAGSFEFINSRPAGAITSNATDMAAYMNALLGHGSAIAPTVRERVLAAEPMPGIGTLAGAGYVSLGFLHERVGGRQVIGHGGDTMYFHSQMTLVPDSDVGIFVAMTGGAKADVRADVVEAFLRRYVSPTQAWPQRPEGSAARAEAVSGNWTLARRTESNFLALANATMPAHADASGDLMFLGETWREVEPWVWESESGVQRIAARAGADGTVDAVAPAGYFAATPGGPLDSMQQAVVLVAALIVLVVSTVTSAFIAVRRRRARRRLVKGTSTHARGGAEWEIATDVDSDVDAGSAPAGESRGLDATGVAGPARWASRFSRLAPWVPVAIIAALASVVALMWPLLQSDLATPLSIPLLRLAQVLLAAAGAGVLAVITRAALSARSRRWWPVAGWVLVTLSTVTVLALAANAGLFLLDATY